MPLPPPAPTWMFRRCPLCGGDAPTPFLTAGDVNFAFPGEFQVVRCGACGMLYTNPAVAPQDLMRFYPDDYSAHRRDRASAQRPGRRGRDPWDRLPVCGRRRLLDVGCGSGAYLLRQQRQGWTAFGVEPSESAAAAARAQGLQVVTGVIPGTVLPERQFEAITVLAALPCIPDPLLTLRTLREMLAPGGTLVVTCHNAGSAAASRFGAAWYGWDLPRGMCHFTAESLTRMLLAADFRDVRLSFRRRSSPWRHAARQCVAQGGGWPWSWMARSRQFCSLVTHVLSRGTRRDEIVAVARG